VQHEAQLLGAGPAHVFVDHAPVGIESAVGNVLAADEGEPHGAIIAGSRRGQRAPDTAHLSRLIDKAIPVLPRRPEARRKKAARPVGGRAHLHIAARDDVRESLIARNLHHQSMHAHAGIRSAARPQDHAVRRGIARCHALRIKITPFRAGAGGLVRTALAEGEGSAEARCLRQQRSACCLSAHRGHSAKLPTLAVPSRIQSGMSCSPKGADIEIYRLSI
jgi:hypothetical protein